MVPSIIAMLVLWAAAAWGQQGPVPPGVVPSALAPQPSAKGWGPPDIDEVRPPILPEITCPQQQVLDQLTNHLDELVDSISRFDAMEHVLHQEYDKKGRLLNTARRKFAYIATISRLGGVPMFEEHRQGFGDPANFPGGIATLGLPSLALVFHPDMREEFELICQGMGEWQGRAAWVLHFRQREDRPNYLLRYKLNGGGYRADLKGRAWVAADDFQILHMEAELVQPVARIGLLRHVQIVDYGLVRFPEKNTDLWLPKNAELYFLFQGHRYHRRHSFDDFRLFAVDVAEKVKLPKQTPP